MVHNQVLSVCCWVSFHDAYLCCRSLAYLHGTYDLFLKIAVLSLCVEEVNENESSCDEDEVAMAYDAFDEDHYSSLETLVILGALCDYLVWQKARWPGVSTLPIDRPHTRRPIELIDLVSVQGGC